MIKMEFKLKKLLGIIFVCSALLSNRAFADMSYGSKFITTTIAGCAVGGAGAYTYANATGFDSQPKQIVTLMGATTGCLTGALFSYLFFDDKTSGLTQQLTADQKTIDDLKNQLMQIQGGQLTGSITNPKIEANAFSTSPLDQNFTSEIIDMSQVNLSDLPTGLAIKNTAECKKWARISLIPDMKSKSKKSQNMQWIALDNNFAVIGIQFAYTNKKCFLPSPIQGGLYYGQYWPGVRDFLNSRVWAIEESLKNN